MMCIFWGFRMLGIDMLVGDDEGNLFRRRNMSPINLYQAHADILRRIKQSTSMSGSMAGKRVSEPKAEENYSSHNLLMLFNKMSCNVNEDLYIIMQLYDAKKQTFFTENFVLHMKGQQILSPPDARRVLFTVSFCFYTYSY